jgi:radical SAM superfamily enzyme YgiQ (UPF0313 family)
VDDNFIGNKRYLKETLLPALIEWRRHHPGTHFYTEASINLADDERLMRMMVEAGFRTVFIGIETTDDASLKECDKAQNRGRDLVADVKRIQRAGLEVQGGFIVGFDSDTPATFQRQVEFIQKSGIVTAMVGVLNALPRTRLYERMKREGRLTGRTSGDNMDGTTNFRPRMSAEALSEGYRDLVRRLYAPRDYYRRVRTFLREYRPPRSRPRLGWGDLRAMLYANVRLGIVGRERFQYWRLMLWTSFRRPALLETAVTLAIYGHHFRKIADALA